MVLTFFTVLVLGSSLKHKSCLVLNRATPIHFLLDNPGIPSTFPLHPYYYIWPKKTPHILSITARPSLKRTREPFQQFRDLLKRFSLSFKIKNTTTTITYYYTFVTSLVLLLLYILFDRSYSIRFFYSKLVYDVLTVPHS